MVSWAISRSRGRSGAAWEPYRGDRAASGSSQSARGSSWNHVWAAMRPHRDHIGVVGLSWGHLGIVFGSWSHPWLTGSSRGRPGVASRSRGHCEPPFPVPVLLGGRPSGASLTNRAWGWGRVLSLLANCFPILLCCWLRVISLPRRELASRLPHPFLFPCSSASSSSSSSASSPSSSATSNSAHTSRGPCPPPALRPSWANLDAGPRSFRHTSHTGRDSYAPYGKFECGTTSVSAHSSRGSCPDRKFHPRHLWASLHVGPRQFRHTAHMDRAPQETPPTTPSGKPACGFRPMSARPSH